MSKLKMNGAIPLLPIYVVMGVDMDSFYFCINDWQCKELWTKSLFYHWCQSDRNLPQWCMMCLIPAENKLEVIVCILSTSAFISLSQKFSFTVALWSSNWRQNAVYTVLPGCWECFVHQPLSSGKRSNVILRWTLNSAD
jgi:hypothetical protein